MSVFDDKKFDELDWISQATEPIVSPINEVLGKLPEEQDITYEIYTQLSDSCIDLSLSDLVNRLINKIPKAAIDLSWTDKNAIKNCFALVMPKSDVILDFENKTLTPGIKLVKIKQTVDEEILRSILGVDGLDKLASIRLHSTEEFSRCGEILELLGKVDPAVFKTKLSHKKIVALRHRMREVMKTNEWKLKDTVLANKVGEWITAYIISGNLAAMSNFCRLKIMTHKEQAIYSMEEVE